jgi:hypothetical protein
MSESGSDSVGNDDSDCSTVTVMMVPKYIDLMSVAVDEGEEEREGLGEVREGLAEPDITLLILEEELGFLYEKVFFGLESLRSAMGLLEELKRRISLR